MQQKLLQCHTVQHSHVSIIQRSIELSLKPEAVQTIFQHVPQPKASTTRKHSIKRTVKSERKEVSKQ